MSDKSDHLRDATKGIMTRAEMLETHLIIKKYWHDSNRRDDCEVLLDDIIEALKAEDYLDLPPKFENCHAKPCNNMARQDSKFCKRHFQEKHTREDHA